MLTDAFGVAVGPRVVGSHRYYPSVHGLADAALLGETRVGWLQELTGGTTLLADVEGRTCGIRVAVGSGSAMVLAAELPSHPPLLAELARSLGVRPGLALDSAVPGVLATTTVSPAGDRLLHLLNPTGYHARVGIGFGGESADYSVPAHSGHLLARGLTAPFGRIESATSELTAISDGGFVLAPSLVPDGHLVVVQTDRTVRAQGAHAHRYASGLTAITAPQSGVPLTVRTE